MLSKRQLISKCFNKALNYAFQCNNVMNVLHYQKLLMGSIPLMGSKMAIALPTNLLSSR